MATYYDQKVVLTETTLPAAGAHLTTSQISINGYKQITPTITYRAGGAGGAVSMYIEYASVLSPLDFVKMGESQAAAIVPGADVNIQMQRAIFTFTPTGLTRENITLPTIESAFDYMRFEVFESGNLANPGSLFIACFLRGDN